MKTPVEKYFGFPAVDGVRRTGDLPPPPDAPAAAAWNLPAGFQIVQSTSVGVRQYLRNGDGLTIDVTALPTGVTYNAGTESLEGAASGTSSGTATFTATGPITDTAEVSLVAPVSGFTPEANYSLSGTLTHGSTLTITKTGGGLGTHPLSIHFAGGAGRWIESAPGDGSAMVSEEIPGWRRESSALKSATDATRGKVLESTQTSTVANLVRKAMTPWVPNNWQYATYWIRRDTFIPDGGTSRGQHKTIRFTDDATLGGNLARTYFNLWTPRPDHPSESASVVWPGYANSKPTGSQYGASSNFDLANDYLWPWCRMEMEIYAVREADNNNAIRRIRYRMPGNTIYEDTILGTSKPMYAWHTADPADMWKFVTFQDYFGNGFSGSNCHIARDDLYVSSNSRARVEIVDGADFTSALWAEIQLPEAWADGSIQFECNVGGFTSLAGKKLYVVLNDGTALLVGVFT